MVDGGNLATPYPNTIYNLYPRNSILFGQVADSRSFRSTGVVAGRWQALLGGSWGLSK